MKKFKWLLLIIGILLFFVLSELAFPLTRGFFRQITKRIKYLVEAYGFIGYFVVAF